MSDNLKEIATAYLAKAIDEQRFRLIPSSCGVGSYHLVFRGKEGVEAIASYINSMADSSPYEARTLNYFPVAQLAYGTIAPGQKEDLFHVTLDSRGLIPPDILSNTRNDGRSQPNFNEISSQLEQWLGNEDETIFSVLSKWEKSSTARDSSREFCRETGRLACRHFFNFIGFPQNITDYQAANPEEAFQILFNQTPPESINNVYERILLQTHERNGNVTLANIVRNNLAKKVQMQLARLEP